MDWISQINFFNHFKNSFLLLLFYNNLLTFVYHFLDNIKYIKNGAPKNDVTTPIGISELVPIFLAIRSQNTKNTPP